MTRGDRDRQTSRRLIKTEVHFFLGSFIIIGRKYV
jgi:hypothetical protein